MSFKRYLKENQEQQALEYGGGGRVQPISDGIGPFAVVTKGTKDSELIDILFMATVTDMMQQALGGLKQDDVLAVFAPGKEKDALAYAKGILEELQSGGEEFVKEY